MLINDLRENVDIRVDGLKSEGRDNTASMHKSELATRLPCCYIF